ncbi:MAG: energy transducer TonB, partial [Thermoanaerobaculia bacterium]
EADVAQRLDAFTPKKTTPMVAAPEMLTEPMTPATPTPPPAVPVEPPPPDFTTRPRVPPTIAEEMPREEYPSVNEPMPTMIDTPMPSAPVIPVAPVFAPVEPPPAPAHAIPPTMADVPFSSVPATLAEVPFSAPATQAVQVDELMPPPPRESSRPRLGIMIVGAMIVLLLGVGAAVVYRFATSRGETPDTETSASNAPALAQTVEAQQSTFRSLRERAGQLQPTAELQQALQSIDEAHGTALSRLEGNDFAAASALLGDSIARLQQILAAPPRVAPTPTSPPRPDVAAALDEWTRVNNSIDAMLDRAARDGVRLDSNVASRLAERKAGVFALLEGGRIDEFSAQVPPLVEAYEEAVRRAAYAKRSEARRAEAKPAPVAPTPTETVEEVVEAPPVTPVEPVAVSRAEPARPIQQVPPRVPSSTIRVRAEGTVVVEVTIDTRGNVSDARIVKPVFPSYDAAALRAAKQWKFQPATINGAPVESRMTLQFAFKP